MPAMELLTPWFTFVVILLPVLYLERWIHQHLYGVGWLLSREKQRATILYYLILLPGVFLHEFTQWLVAGALNLKTTKIRIWPKPQSNGTLRLDFVKLSGKEVVKTKTAVFETAPLVAGIVVIWYISQHILDTALIVSALRTADLGLVFYAFGALMGTPDFWLWLYLLFAIGNAMIPTDSLNNLSWLMTASLVVGVALFVLGLLSGTGVSALQKPLTGILDLLATAAGTMLVMDLCAVIILGLAERTLERITGNQAKYPRTQTSKPIKPEPGGEAPLPQDQVPERIWERKLPIPPPPKSTSTRKSAAPAPQIVPSNYETAPRESARPSWVDRRSSVDAASPHVDTESNDEPIDDAPLNQHHQAVSEAQTTAVPANATIDTAGQGENGGELGDEPTYVDVDSDIA